MADSKLNKSDKRSNLAKQNKASPQRLEKSESSGKSVSPLLSPLALMALGLTGAAIAEVANKAESVDLNQSEGKSADLMPAETTGVQIELFTETLAEAGPSNIEQALQDLVQSMASAQQATPAASSSEEAVSEESAGAALPTELSNDVLMAAASSASSIQNYSDSTGKETLSNGSADVILAQANTSPTGAPSAAASTSTTAAAGAEASAAAATGGLSQLALVGILAGVAVAAGGSSSSGPAGDTTAPIITSMGAKIGTSVITLTYNEALDASKVPQTSAFSITTGGQANAVTSVTINGNVVTLNLTSQIAAGNVSVAYTDPTSSNDVNAIQDTAGNDAVTFLQGKLADGYIRGAQIYIDTNKNGTADTSEALAGVVTDADGNFFLPSTAPKGTIIAVGGVNIDTGVPNTIPLKAPEGSTTINPLTTLVQAVVDNSAKPGATLLTPAQAATQVANALGLDLPAGASLTSYDPLSATDSGALEAQKASAQIATLVTLAANSNATTANAVQSNLAILVTESTTIGALDLTDSSTVLEAVTVTGVSVSQDQLNAINTANNAIAQAETLNDIAVSQADALDKVAPATPTLTVAALGNDATPAVKVTLNTKAIDGSAVVAGDTVVVYEGTTALSAATTITADDIAAGFVTINTSALAEGSHTLSARVTDKADNISTVGTAAGTTATAVIDLTAPTASNVTSSSEDTGASASDRLTKDNTPTLSITAEAGSTVKVYNGETLLGNATEGAQGVFSYTTAALADGVHVLSAKATDPAGNTGAAGTTYSVTIDTAAPTASTLSPADGGQSLGLAANLILTASQEIAKGTGNITLYKADGTVAESFAVSSDKVTINGSAISINPSADLTKDQAYYVKVDAGAFTDLAGNAFAGISDATTWNFTAAGATIATSDIATNNVINAAELAAGVQVSGTVTAEFTTGTLTAQLQPSTGDAINLENVVYNQETGAWTADVPKSLSGTTSYTLNTTFTGSGSAAGITGTGQKSVQLDTVAPTAAAASLATNSGSTADTITNVGTVNITGLELNATWQYSTDKGANWLTGSGSSVTLTGDGDKSIIVKQTDTAGNVSNTSTAFDFTLDTTAPAKGTITQITENSGYSGADRLTNDTTPVLTFTATAGQKLILGSGNQALADSVYSVTDDNGTYTVTVNTALTDGGYGIVVLDAAGNYAELKTDGTDGATFLIDQTAPTAPTITTLTTDSGVLGDLITNDKTPTLTVTTEPGIGLKLMQNTTEVTNATIEESKTTPGSYTVTVAGDLNDGNYNLVAIDGAGNKSTSTASAFKVDTSAPSQPVITALSIDGGTAGDRLTNATPVLTVTAEAGAKLFVGQASTVAGSGPVEITTPYTVEETSAGVYSVTFSSALADGIYGLMALDAAGNRSLSPASLQSTATFAIDKVAPSLNISLLENTQVPTFEFAFSEAVKGFDASDVIVENGTKGAFTVIDNKTYRVEVELDASTSPVLFKVNANANAGQDFFGNASTAPSAAFSKLTLIGTTGADVLTNDNAAATYIDLSEGGNDTIKLTSASHATVSALDEVNGFTSGDKIDLSAILKTAAGYTSSALADTGSGFVELKNVGLAQNTTTGKTNVTFDVHFDAAALDASKINGAIIDLVYDYSKVSAAQANSATYIDPDFGNTVNIWSTVVSNLSGSSANGKIALAPDLTELTFASNPIITSTGKTLGVTLIVNSLVSTFDVGLEAKSAGGLTDISTVNGATNNVTVGVTKTAGAASGGNGNLVIVTDADALTTVTDNQLHMLVKYVSETDTTQLRVQYDTNSATGTTAVSEVIALDFSGDVTTNLTPAALTFI